MQEEIVFAGFGGQGVLFGGQLLAYTALAEGKYVTWIPSYGPEMRGGTANCTVIVSDEAIGSPVTKYPSVGIVFNNPSLDKYEELIKPGGLLIVNQSMVVRNPVRTDIEALVFPATALATELGDTKMTNSVLFGALLARRPIVSLEMAKQVLIEKLGQRKAHLHAINIAALERGYEIGMSVQA